MRYIFISLTVLIISCISLLVGKLQADDAKCSKNSPQVHGVYGLNPYNEPIKTFLLSDPLLSGISLRVEWKLLQPAKDKFNWSYLDREIKKAQKAGKQVTIRVFPGIHTPDWVYKESAKRFTFVDKYPYHAKKYKGEKATYGKKLSIPVPWDEKFLKSWEKFVFALGARYKDNPCLAIVHLSGPTRHSAEMILPHSPEDKKQWLAIGYTPEKLIHAWRRTIDAFAAAFPHSALSLNLSPIIFDDEVMEEVTKYGYEKYGRRFLLQNNALAAKPNPKRTDFGLIKKYSSKTTVGFQMLAIASSKIDDRQGDLKQSIDQGLSRGASYFEIYPEDVRRLPWAIKYAVKKLQEKHPPENK